MDIVGLIMLVIWIAVVIAVAWGILELLKVLALPPPFVRIITIVLTVIAILVCLLLIVNFVGGVDTSITLGREVFRGLV